MTFNGFYGHLTPTPCTVFYYEGWYCVKGSELVNYTECSLFDGVNLQDVENEDCFTWSSPVETEEQLREAVRTYNR